MFQRRRNQSGVALITVMAILSILAVVAFSFLAAARLELAMSKSFSQFMRVEDVAEAALRKTSASLYTLQNGPDNIPYSGDEARTYDSKMDPWYVSFQGALARDSIYSARGYTPGRLLPVKDFPDGLADPEYYLPTSLDEDPPGDLSFQMGYDIVTAPGLFGIDDDGDGLTDEDNLGVLKGKPGYNSFFDYDDDEDGQVDEDPGYLPPDSTFVNPAGAAVIADPRTHPYLKEHYLVDDDGDYSGVEDQSALLNLNWAGNVGLSYDEGIDTFELDIQSFFINLGWPVSQAQTLAKAIIDYRMGQDGVPGRTGDDNGNNSAEAGFNGLDDDHDGQVDEFDEIYIGTPRQGLFNAAPTDILGDGLDNDADGQTDELDEGVDEPSEFNRVFDNNFGSVDELALVPGFESTDFTFGTTSNFEKVRRLVTIYSCSPQITSGCGEVVNDPVKGPYSPRLINPSLLLTYQARANSLGGVNYLLPMQLDNDHDWDAARDDHNHNGRPDGDWDSGPEADTRDPRFSSDSIDNDHDGRVDEPGEGNGVDDDRDGLIDDDGDINGDGNTGYDPEWGVNEDPWGDANGDGYPGVKGIDDDGDGGIDFNDPQVKKALDAIKLVGWADDGIDNDWDGDTDEPGEPYIAAWDDDEDGRFDEDPPEYPWLLNMADSIDQPIGNFDSPTIVRLYGYSGRQVRDPLTRYAAYLGTPYNQLPVPVTSQADGGLPPMIEGTKADDFRDLNSIGTFQGLEGVRINEVMSTPVIHLEAENADEFKDAKDSAFKVGADDDTKKPSDEWYDSSWSTETTQLVFTKLNLTSGPYVRELYDTGEPRINRGYFRVINDPWAEFVVSEGKNRDPKDERAVWSWTNIPDGDYDLVITMGPAPISPFAPDVSPAAETELQRNWKINNNSILSLGGWKNTVNNPASRSFRVENVQITGGQLDIDITIPGGLGRKGLHGAGWGEHDVLWLSFDSVDLFAKGMQYVELINLSRMPVDVSGWQIWVQGQNSNKYVIDKDAVVPPFDIANPTDFRNYLLIVPDANAQNDLAKFYGAAITVPVKAAVSDTGRGLALSELTAQNDINPREGVVQLVGPVAGTGVNLVALDQTHYYTARLNPFKPTGRLGFIAQERRDPAELRFATAIESKSNNVQVNTVTQETPTMRFYARAAERPTPNNNFDRLRLLGGKITDAADTLLGSRLGMYFAVSNVSDTNRIRFLWKDSAKSAVVQDPQAVYQVRVFGVLNHPVGQVVIPDAPGGSDLNANWLSPKWDTVDKDLYITQADRLTRAQMHHGNVVFYWYPTEQGDLTLELVCNGEARDPVGAIIPSDKDPGFYFDYVEVTRVGVYNPGDPAYVYRTGTPGAPNGFYQPDYDPRTALPWGVAAPGAPAVFNGKVSSDFGLDRDAKTQRYVPVKNGGLASPGYIVNVHNGQPFGRFGILEASPCLFFLSGWRNEGAMLPGQININTAPLPVLSALPWAPPSMAPADRAKWNWIVAQHVVLGRRVVGHDGVFGAVDTDGDGILDPQPQSAYKQRGSDDGPYESIVDLLPVLFSDGLHNELVTAFPGQVDKADLTMGFARACNLATTRSLVFSVYSRGQILDLSPDREDMVVSQKVMQSVFLRFAQ